MSPGLSARRLCAEVSSCSLITGRQNSGQGWDASRWRLTLKNPLKSIRKHRVPALSVFLAVIREERCAASQHTVSHVRCVGKKTFDLTHQAPINCLCLYKLANIWMRTRHGRFDYLIEFSWRERLLYISLTVFGDKSSCRLVLHVSGIYFHLGKKQ